MIKAIKNFFIGSYAEFRKVVWPNRQEVISHTVIVIVSTAIAMSLVAAIDYGLFNLVQTLVQGK